MIRFDQPDRCAFCGELIGSDEPRSGRGEAAAHVACADRALGDDRFWDRIAAGLGDSAPAASDEPSGADATGVRGGSDDRPTATDARGPSSAARTGCGAILAATIVIVLAARVR